MMKFTPLKKAGRVLLVCAAALVAGCQGQAPFPAVRAVFVAAYEPGTRGGSLTRDGRALTLPDLSQVDLERGEVSYPFAGFAASEWNLEEVAWSPDGRSLLAGGYPTEPPEAYRRQVLLLDAARGSFNLLPDEVSYYSFAWSPFGRRFLTRVGGGVPPVVYDLEARGAVGRSPVTRADEMEREELGGAGLYLWSRKLNVPVAWIARHDPLNLEGARETQSLMVKSVRVDEDGSLTPLQPSTLAVFPFLPPDNLVDASFDPGGEYILAVQWLCAPEDPRQCTQFEEAPYFASVTDTALILIRWQTGAQQELLRLSEADPAHVVGLYAQWSWDGSTVLVWRQDAPPVVLRLK